VRVVPETTILGHVDQQVDVAVRLLLVTQNRTEQADVGGAVPGCDGQEHVSLAVKVL